MATENMDIGINITGNAHQQLSKIQEEVNKVNSSFALMKTALASLALGSMVSAVMELGDQISDTADAFGVATGEVLSLTAALEAAGGKGDNAVKIFQGIATSVDELNDGNLKTLKSFEDLGFSLTDLGKMSESEIRNKVITQLAEMDNKTEAASLAMKMFGKAAIGVDFTKLADEIKNNKDESEKFGEALKTAGDAADAMAHLGKQVKIAFAEAFSPLFKMLSEIHVETQDIADAFVLLAKAIIPVVVALTAVKGAIVACEVAMAAFNAVSNANPWIAGAKVIIAGLTAAGIITATNTDKQEENNKESEKAEGITAKTVVKTGELNNKLQQQREELMKIGDAYKNNTSQLNTQYNLLLSSQRVSAIEYQQSKALNDLELKFTNDLKAAKEQFNKLDLDSQNRQKQAYLENVKAINDQYDIQRELTAARIIDEQLIKAQTESQLAIANINVDSLKTMAKMKSDADSLLMTTQQQIEQEYALKSFLETISILQKDINNSAFLTTDEKKKYLNTVSQIKTIEEGIVLANDLSLKTHTNIGYAITKQNSEFAKQSELAGKIAENSRSFSAGWTQAFTQYVDNATNAANKARNMFDSVVNNMNSAIDNFVESGKFSFGDFAQSVIKDLIKIELKASAMNLWKMMNAGGGGEGGLFSAAASMMGFAGGGNPPIGKASIVGENGPEIIVPRTAQTVIPNGAGSQQQQPVYNITNNISAVDAAGVGRLFAQNRQMLLGSIEQARKELPTRGSRL